MGVAQPSPALSPSSLTEAELEAVGLGMSEEFAVWYAWGRNCLQLEWIEGGVSLRRGC
jgi:hypothetical protein